MGRLMILALILWFLVVVVTGFIVYGFLVVLLVKVQSQRAIFRNRPLPPQRSNVRVLHREQP